MERKRSTTTSRSDLSVVVVCICSRASAASRPVCVHCLLGAVRCIDDRVSLGCRCQSSWEWVCVQRLMDGSDWNGMKCDTGQPELRERERSDRTERRREGVG
jgi:hypothetical protein